MPRGSALAIRIGESNKEIGEKEILDVEDFRERFV
jgi:hypothetical protein